MTPIEVLVADDEPRQERSYEWRGWGLGLWVDTVVMPDGPMAVLTGFHVELVPLDRLVVVKHAPYSGLARQTRDEWNEDAKGRARRLAAKARKAAAKEVTA